MLHSVNGSKRRNELLWSNFSTQLLKKSSGEQSAEKVCSNSPCPCTCRENSPSNSRELQLQKQRDKQRFSLSPCTGMVRVCCRSSLLWSPLFSGLLSSALSARWDPLTRRRSFSVCMYAPERESG